MKNCPTLKNILEDSNYSPEAQKFLISLRCRRSKPWSYYWCPDTMTEINQFANYPIYNENRPNILFPGDMTIRSTNITVNREHDNNSKGFVWGKTATEFVDSNTKGKFFTTAKPEDTKKNTVLYGHTNIPNVKSDSKHTQTETPEVDGRIYFPDEEFPKFTRKAKSFVLDKLSSSCGRSFYQNLEKSANHTASLGEFPWIALLAYDIGGITVPNCAGTLISPRHILTAASCLHQADESQWDLSEL